jgi:hypothetical protein
MEHRHSSPSRKAVSPRPSTQRQRSNSFPIVEALGCSTPEAQLILAEGRAAVRKRRARGRRNRSFDDEDTVSTFRPQDHLKYLDSAVGLTWTIEKPVLSEARSCHARIPSNATDRSTSTIVALPRDTELCDTASPTSPLGNYSAHLAQFIKAQLKSIPTYQSEHDFVTTLSPRSCPEFSFPLGTPPLSPNKSIRRLVEAPKAIDIPPVRPPIGRSAFSAWSSTEEDDEVDEDAPSLPDMDQYTMDALCKASTYTPSVLGYYEASNNASFLFSSTPAENEEGPDTAKGHNFPVQAPPRGSASQSKDDNDYPSSSLSQPQLTSSSAPSYSSSSASASSYFDCKRPSAIGPEMKDRIIAALTPPHLHGKIISAISPWEGGAIANVHDVYVESQQRVHVDGMSFDMLRDFIAPDRVSTPC